MAVDFAAKRRERRGEEWALRRFKLRMSRKLIFVAGLSACLSCELRPSGLLQGGFDSDGDFCSAMTEHLLEFVQLTPLEILARMIIDHEAYDGGCQALQAYDDFLGVLSDEDKRGRLASLSPGDDQDRLFVETNDIAHDFQEALMKVFFKTSPDLTKCTQRYGVF